MSIVVRGGRWGTGVARRGGRRRAGPAPLELRVPSPNEHSIVAFVQTKQTMGVAVFEPQTADIKVQQVQLDAHYSAATFIKEKCSPCTIVVPNFMTNKLSFLKAVLGDDAHSIMPSFNTQLSDDEIEVEPSTATRATAITALRNADADEDEDMEELAQDKRGRPTFTRDTDVVSRRDAHARMESGRTESRRTDSISRNVGLAGTQSAPTESRHADAVSRDQAQGSSQGTRNDTQHTAHVQSGTQSGQNGSHPAGGVPGEQDGASALKQRFDVVPNALCKAAKAKSVVSMLSVLAMPADLCGTERLAYLGHIFDEHEICLRATAVLLTYLVREQIVHCKEAGDVCVNSVKYGQVLSGMQISSSSMFALQIFHKDTHPAGRGAANEKDWGLFGIIGANLKSPPSFRTLRAWMKSPLTDVEAIQGRLTVVEIFKRDENVGVVKNLRDTLRTVKHVPRIIHRIENVSAGFNDWYHLYCTAKSFIIVLDTFKNLTDNFSDLLNTKLYEEVNGIELQDLRVLINYIESIIDFDESKAEKRLFVKDGFNPDIDEQRRCLNGLHSFLTEVGKEEMKRLMREKPGGVELSSLNYKYEHHIGYLVDIEKADVDRIGLDVLKDEFGMELVFKTSEDSFWMFKDARCLTLDGDLGDVRGMLISMEAKVVRYLEAMIKPLFPAAYMAANAVAQLDCLLAFAATADKNDWNRPDVSNNAEGLHIVDGRHALLELTTPTFQSNNTYIRCGGVNVITGPNFSGKSVYLKQNALIAYLAQIGSFVPAKSVNMRPFRALFTRLLSIDSVSEGMSSFFIDSAQVASFLVSEKSPRLVILDEYGKGTSPIGGVALLAAVLRSVLKNNDKSSIVLCATHQPEIFDAGIMPNDTNLGTLSMEMVRVDSESDTTNTNSISKARKTHSDSTPSSHATTTEGKEAMSDYVRTYRLIPGTICTESRAVQCALEFGIRRGELRRAMNIKANATAAPRNGTEESENGLQKNMIVVQLLNTDMKEVWVRTKVFTRMRNSTTNTASRG